MKPHLQCAEQQVSRSNLTKYCACHAERLTYLVLITYETSFTVRGATGVTIQPHQILRLPRKMTRLLYRPHIWNVISNARSNRCHYPTSPNTAPVTKKTLTDYKVLVLIHMKRHFQCAEQSDHVRPWSDHDANTATRLAKGYFSTHHEHFLWKINVAPNHIWNLIYNARSNRCHDPTSPNTAPVTQKDSHT